jgi:hypothetical protein
VAIEFVGRPRRAELLEVARAGEGAPVEHRKPPFDQRAVGEFAGPQDAVEPFADHVQRLMRFAEMQANARVHISEAQQAGQQEKPRLSAMHVDANESRRLGVDEGALRILEIGDQADVTLIIGFAVQRRADLAGRSLK